MPLRLWLLRLYACSGEAAKPSLTLGLRTEALIRVREGQVTGRAWLREGQQGRALIRAGARWQRGYDCVRGSRAGGSRVTSRWRPRPTVLPVKGWWARLRIPELAEQIIARGQLMRVMPQDSHTLAGRIPHPLRCLPTSRSSGWMLLVMLVCG